MSYIYIYMEHLFLMFLDHTQRRSTVDRTPLDVWSARCRDLYLTTHDTHNRQISMPPVGFEPTISVGERPAAIFGLCKGEQRAGRSRAKQRWSSSQHSCSQFRDILGPMTIFWLVQTSCLLFKHTVFSRSGRTWHSEKVLHLPHRNIAHLNELSILWITLLVCYLQFYTLRDIQDSLVTTALYIRSRLNLLKNSETPVTWMVERLTAEEFTPFKLMVPCIVIQY
jgi:hypothetical protein